MAKLMIIRPIHLLPGREAEALAWLGETADVRTGAGQIEQVVLRGIVDSADYMFVQTWESREAYERWRETSDRQRLAVERQRFLTHDPARLYEVIE